MGMSGTTDFLAPQLWREKWQQLKLVGSTLGLNAFGNVWIPKLVYPSGTQTGKRHTYTKSCQGSLSVAGCCLGSRSPVHTHFQDAGSLDCKLQVTENPGDV